MAPTFTATRRLADASFSPTSDDPDDLLDPSPPLGGSSH
jgi:hypothetical protein